MWYAAFLASLLPLAHVAAQTESILTDAAVASSRHATTVADLEEMDHVSKYGVQILAGMLETFLRHDNPTNEELGCMLSAVNNYTHLAYQAAGDVAQVFAAAMGGPKDSLAAAAVAAADLMLAVPKLEASLERLADLLAHFMGPCLGEQAQNAVTKAESHLMNLTYVEGHLRANGADIVEEIAQATRDFQEMRLRSCGRSVGRAVRKVLLSKATEPMLPEGAPSEQELVKMSAGIIQGFFGKGFELIITSDAKLVTEPQEPVGEEWSFLTEPNAAAAPKAPEPERVNLHIDLHKCVKDNLKYFQSATYGTSFYFAQLESNLQDSGELNVPAMLTATLQALPQMLRTCGISEKQQEMLVDSLFALNQIHIALQVTKPPEMNFNKTVAQLQKAADDWKALDWFALGKDLGRMLLGLVLQTYPQEYSVDDTGALRKQLLGLSAASPAARRQGLPPVALAVPALMITGLAVGFLRRSPVPARLLRCEPTQETQEDAEHGQILALE